MYGSQPSSRTSKPESFRATADPMRPHPRMPTVWPARRVTGPIRKMSQAPLRVWRSRRAILRARAEEQRHRVVRDLVGPVVRHVDHRHAVVGGRGHVDPVHADAVPHQHPDARKPFQNAPRDGPVLDQQAVGLAAALEVLRLGARGHRLEPHAGLWRRPPAPRPGSRGRGRRRRRAARPARRASRSEGPLGGERGEEQAGRALAALHGPPAAHLLHGGRLEALRTVESRHRRSLGDAPRASQFVCPRPMWSRARAGT